MATITAAMVKELRELTGAGMMDCKKALNETNGDKEKAVEFLREKGLAAIAKKANRIAAEGLVATILSDDHKVGAIVEVNSETDFVAKNAVFQEYVGRVAAQALASNAKTVEEFMAEAWIDDASLTVEQALSQKISVIGEKLSIRRFEKVTTDGVLTTYIHGGGKIGVIVELTTDAAAEAVLECGKNVAMQIAALKPEYTNRSEVSADYIAHEEEILLAQIKNDPKESQKPEKVIAGMVSGRINKMLKDICLVDQVYVKAEDGKQTVGKYVEAVAKEVGTAVAIKGFVRFETGEGMEKKEENFAEEVAKQMAGN
ncbi:MAG: elongation factor Ts [Lachnospiraceae bacterium]|nr:elongation factor Ts [Lachnospiraceae bacterium]